jgi:hypothetical protein
MERIIDTNIPLTAAGEQASMGEECRQACVQILSDIYADKYKLVLDSSGIIIGQYGVNFRKDGDQGLAWKFMKWVYNNHFIADRVRLVDIVPVGPYGDFEELPEEVRNSSFDHSDRVFVALSVANGNSAPIVQAADSKWIGHQEMLARHGVKLEFPCREALEAVHTRKTISKRRQ